MRVIKLRKAAKSRKLCKTYNPSVLPELNYSDLRQLKKKNNNKLTPNNIRSAGLFFP